MLWTLAALDSVIHLISLSRDESYFLAFCRAKKALQKRSATVMVMIKRKTPSKSDGIGIGIDRFLWASEKNKEALQRRSVAVIVMQTDQMQNAPSTSKSDWFLWRKWNNILGLFFTRFSNKIAPFKSRKIVYDIDINIIDRFLWTAEKNIKHKIVYMAIRPWGWCLRYLHNVFAKDHAESERCYLEPSATKDSERVKPCKKLSLIVTSFPGHVHCCKRSFNRNYSFRNQVRKHIADKTGIRTKASPVSITNT